MSKWTAIIINDPNNDYKLMVEISYDNKDVAIITQTNCGLELTWYAHDKNLVVPFDWLFKLMNSAKKEFSEEMQD